MISIGNGRNMEENLNKRNNIEPQSNGSDTSNEANGSPTLAGQGDSTPIIEETIITETEEANDDLPVDTADENHPASMSEGTSLDAAEPKTVSQPTLDDVADGSVDEIVLPPTLRVPVGQPVNTPSVSNGASPVGNVASDGGQAIIIEEPRTTVSGVPADGEMKTTIIPEEIVNRSPSLSDVNQSGRYASNGVLPQNGGNVVPTQMGGWVEHDAAVPPTPPVIPPQGTAQNGWSDDSNGGESTLGGGMPKWAVGLISAGAAVVLSLGIGFGALSAGWVKIPSDAVGSSVSSIGKSNGNKTINATGVNSWAEVADSVSDSVVSIQAGANNQESTGSGAVLDRQGHIVTNNHVVAGSDSIVVTMSNGQIIKATVVGADPSTDLAVIKLDSVPKAGLNPVEFADSNDLVVGQGVMSIGSPLGYANTVTTGVISATDRPVVIATQGASNGYAATDAIQIDAAINPGNSGGPTFDSIGKVIGINSSIASTSTNQSEVGNVGIGFAIPSNLVKSITSSIIKDGEAKHVWLGVSMSGQDATVTVDDVTRSGAQIVKITPGSPAEKSGVQVGDVIIGWNGEPVENSSSLMSRVRSVALGENVNLTIVRNGKLMDVKVTFDQVDPNNGKSQAQSDGTNNNNDGNSSNDQSQGDMSDLEDLLRQFGFSR